MRRLLSVCPLATHFTSRALSILMCKMQKTATLENFCKDSLQST